MKFLIITNDLSGQSGYSTYAKNIVTPLLAMGHEVVAAVQESEPLLTIPQYQIFHDDALRYLWHPFRIYAAAKTLRKIVESEKPDILHFVVEPYQQVLAFMSVPPATKVVLTVHGTYTYLPDHLRGVRKSVGNLLYKRAHAKLDGVIAVSECTKQRYLGKNRPFKKEISVIHNATNLPPIACEESLEKKAPYHAITIGEVKNRKGIKEAIEVLSLWSKKHSVRVTYDVVGNLPEETTYVQHVIALANELSHEYFSVTFHGRVNDERKNTLLQNASVYMHLEPAGGERKNVEGFGIGIIDAAALAIPAIVSRGTATAEAIIDKKTGVAVDPDDRQECLVAVTGVLHDKSYHCVDIVQWAKKHVPDKLIGQYLDFLVK